MYDLVVDYYMITSYQNINLYPTMHAQLDATSIVAFLEY
jgi:hypothetical protein